MAQFIDVHTGMKGMTTEQLEKAHMADQKYEAESGVHFVKAWADPDTGKVFCLSEGPNKEAVLEVHRRAGHPTDEIYAVPIATK
jgi:hypothetical protein